MGTLRRHQPGEVEGRVGRASEAEGPVKRKCGGEKWRILVKGQVDGFVLTCDGVREGLRRDEADSVVRP